MDKSFYQNVLEFIHTLESGFKYNYKTHRVSVPFLSNEGFD